MIPPSEASSLSISIEDVLFVQYSQHKNCEINMLHNKHLTFVGGVQLLRELLPRDRICPPLIPQE